MSTTVSKLLSLNVSLIMKLLSVLKQIVNVEVSDVFGYRQLYGVGRIVDPGYFLHFVVIVEPEVVGDANTGLKDVPFSEPNDEFADGRYSVGEFVGAGDLVQFIDSVVVFFEQLLPIESTFYFEARRIVFRKT